MLPDADLIRLRHMLDSAQIAIAFASDRTRADLDDLPVLIEQLRATIDSD